MVAGKAKKREQKAQVKLRNKHEKRKEKKRAEKKSHVMEGELLRPAPEARTVGLPPARNPPW